MKQSTREALDAYYREAGSWATDKINTLRKSRRNAWIIALTAVVVAVMEGLALMLLTPLKTVVPYTLLVDRSTGFVQELKPLEPNKITPDQALIQSMLVQYVIARENFDIATLQTDYKKIGLWSAGQARTDYLTLMQASNLDSPLTRYPRSSIIETRVKSVSPLGHQAALVRFETLRRDEGGQYQPALPWVAVVRYRFSGDPMSVEDRFLNPLGFQVLEYRRNAEALTPPVAAPSSPESVLDPIDVDTSVSSPAPDEAP